MRRISAWMRGYFAFSHAEARGAVLLIALTLSGMAVAAYVASRTTVTSASTEQDRRMLDSLVAILEDHHLPTSTTPPASKPFLFDPNTADSATLCQLGLSPRLARRVINYRSKGGMFRRKEDFSKIYGLPEATYQRLYSFIQLPERLNAPRTARAGISRRRSLPPPASEERSTLSWLNINTSDTAQLKQLPGIGSTLAARIVKYRQKLGGYHSVEQLEEIYHMTDQGLKSLKARTLIQPEDSLRRVNINHADLKTLAQHPYISWDLARALVQHRQNYGEYGSLDDLREVYLMTEKVFEKVAPYLEI